MQKIIFDTLNGLHLFSKEISDVFIFNIPHSSTTIPDTSIYLNDNWKTDIKYLTDWATEKIFAIENIDTQVAHFSRIWCDVERFDDDKIEPMSKNGHGFYYTHDIFGNLYRNNSFKYLIKDAYQEYHNSLTIKINEKIRKYGWAVIVDCHSFLDFPCPIDIQKDIQRPDICLGTNCHTPKTLLDQFKLGFEKFGYSVFINKPFSGTFVPTELYNTKKNVLSIMVEINKKLYMDIKQEKGIIIDQNILDNKVKILQKQIATIILGN